MTAHRSSAPLAAIFAQVSRRIDAGALVREHLTREPGPPPTHVLALGKAARPMFDGWRAATAGQPDAARGALLVAPAPRLGDPATLPAWATALASDHPDITSRSVTAATAARSFVTALASDDRLLVLLSGGASALCAAPAPGVTLEDKRDLVRAVARAGATIRELNTVRKHLSAIKGGRLAAACAAPARVLALSDVPGDDPSAIGSGPFSADPTTFADALAIVRRRVPAATGTAIAHLERGAAGAHADTPKPGDPRLRDVTTAIVATPARVRAEAAAAAAGLGLPVAEPLWTDTEDDVAALAARVARVAEPGPPATAALPAPWGGPRLHIGNGEPAITVPSSAGRGGRATHLALLVARALAGRRGVQFLAAGTDDRDGSGDASGALVDGDTWPRAQAAGLDPEGALAACDSERPLAALGALVRGPGTSNLLDLHLLLVDAEA